MSEIPPPVWYGRSWLTEAVKAPVTTLTTQIRLETLKELTVLAKTYNLQPEEYVAALLNSFVNFRERHSNVRNRISGSTTLNFQT